MVKTSGIDLLGFLLVCTSIWGSIIFSAAAADDSLEKRCSDVIAKLGECVDYATGKKETPSKDCCVAATEMREKDPVCLCYVIQQTHKGNANLKQLGLQEAKILQLPAACNIKNSSVSDCPKYLNLSPSSPDYAFFTNSSTKATSSSPAVTTSSPTKTDGSDGIMPRPGIAAAVAIVVSITGFVSMIHT